MDVLDEEDDVVDELELSEDPVEDDELSVLLAELEVLVDLEESRLSLR